jgi:hypothetical protein
MDNKEKKKLAKTPDDEEPGGGVEPGVFGLSALGDGAGVGVQSAGVLDLGAGVVGGVFVEGGAVVGGVAPGEPETVMASF